MLDTLFELLNKREVFFRFENDEDGYHLSIIDRQIYPRIWADNSRDSKESIIAETPDNILEKAMIGGKDWTVRLFGKTIQDCIDEFNKWDKQNRMPRLK